MPPEPARSAESVALAGARVARFGESARNGMVTMLRNKHLIDDWRAAWQDAVDELEGYKALSDRLGHGNADLRAENDRLREFVSRHACGLRPKGLICCEAHAMLARHSDGLDDG